jgi:hypothetical protein
VLLEIPGCAPSTGVGCFIVEYLPRMADANLSIPRHIPQRSPDPGLAVKYLAVGLKSFTFLPITRKD